MMTSKSVTVSLRFLRWAGGKAVDGKCLRSDGRARVGVACCDVGDDGRGLEARFPARDATTPKNMTAHAASMQEHGTWDAMPWSGCASLHTHGMAETPPQ